MKQKPREIESVSIRRAAIADADKVRYRVYRSPSDFIAVIAENALLAVKASGVKNPHKIVRDLPTDGIAVAAQKMAAITDADAKVMLPLAQQELQDRNGMLAELRADPPTAEERFVAMGVADLQRKGEPRARIMPPDMLYSIIEQHVRSQPMVVNAAPPTPAPTPEPVVMHAPEPEPAPAPEVPELTNDIDEILHAKPTQPTADSITTLALEVLPPTVATPPVDDAVESVLTPEEVEALLNAES